MQSSTASLPKPSSNSRKSSTTSWDDFTPEQKALTKKLLEERHLAFTRFFFKEVQGMPFRVGPHHGLIGDALDRVIRGEITRLIISVPPGYTKTEQAVIAFIARGMAITKGRGRFIHASFSKELVNENSSRIKDVIASEPYRDMWGIDLRADASGKGLWRTPQGGGLLAKPAGGPITGFRAGLMEEGFTGALVIDDPLKPDDLFKTIARDGVNKRWHTTFKSRLALETVPVIVIMQRLHRDDFAGYLLSGGANCEWHHLMLPILIDNAQPYPEEFTHGVPIEHDLPDGPLWDLKHTLPQIDVLRADNFTFQAQYMQRPIALGGNLFKEPWIDNNRWRELPDLSYRIIIADTAQKVSQANDYSVFQCWGKGQADGDAYLIDQVRGKFEAPQLLEVAKAFWSKHMATNPHKYGVLRYMGIEDKVSGTGLIQTLSLDGNIPVAAIERGTDKNKYQRAQDVIPFYATGRVHVPADDVPGCEWVMDWKQEHMIFTGLGDTHDDQVDPAVDAVKALLIEDFSYQSWVG